MRMMSAGLRTGPTTTSTSLCTSSTKRLVPCQADQALPRRARSASTIPGADDSDTTTEIARASFARPNSYVANGRTSAEEIDPRSATTSLAIGTFASSDSQRTSPTRWTSSVDFQRFIGASKRTVLS